MGVEALLRNGARGTGNYIPIGMEEALRTATMWLSMIRHDQPESLALCVGKANDVVLVNDWAQKFGTPNLYSDRLLSAANAPDARRTNRDTKLVLALGSGNGHGAMSTQGELAKMHRQGARIISVNPIKTGLSVLADQWISITPGTDEVFMQAVIDELHHGRFDETGLQATTISPHTVRQLGQSLKDNRGAVTVLAGRGVLAHRTGCLVSELIEKLDADILPTADAPSLPRHLQNAFRRDCQAIVTVGAHLPWKLPQTEYLLKVFREKFDGHIIAMSDKPESFDNGADLVFCGKAEENLLQLAARLGLEGFSDPQGSSPYKNGYADYSGKGVLLPKRKRFAASRQLPAGPRISNPDDVWGLSDHYPFWAVSQKPGSDSNRAILFMQTQKAAQLGFADRQPVVVSGARTKAKAILATFQDMDANTVWSWGPNLFSATDISFDTDATTGQPAWFDSTVRVDPL